MDRIAARVKLSRHGLGSSWRTVASTGRKWVLQVCLILQCFDFQAKNQIILQSKATNGEMEIGHEMSKKM